MLQKKQILVFLSLILFSSLQGQSSSRVQKIPFTLNKANNLVLEAILNEQDTLQLMFHTAASSVSLIKEATERLKSIQLSEGAAIKTWGGDESARFSQDNRLQIQDLTWDSLTIWENQFSGPGTDGKCGPDLFSGKVIEINFDQQLILIHDQLPAKTNQQEALTLSYENGFMFLEGTAKSKAGKFSHRYLIHTGYGGTLLLDDDVVKNHQLEEALKVVDEKILKDAYGNEIKTLKAILPKFQIAGFKMKELPVGFFAGSLGRQKISVMGGDLVKRFNWVISADRNQVFLQSNQLMELPFAKG